MRGRVFLLLLAGVGFAMSACGRPPVLDTVPPLPTVDTRQAIQHRDLYLRSCASCHGQDAEGAPGWATPGPEGYSLAPAHDDTGHTWHHPDRVLQEAIREGMADPLLPGSPLRMPAFGATLTEEEIESLIAYFKSLWSEEHRRWQWNETLRDASNPPTPFGGDG